MKLPRDLSGAEMVKILKKNGFVVKNQRGSHVTLEGPKGQMVVVPQHPSLKVGTLSAIIKQSGLPRDDLF